MDLLAVELPEAQHPERERLAPDLAGHLEPDLVLRAVLVVVRAQVKAALAQHLVLQRRQRSSIPRMARFPTQWLAARNRTT